MKIISRNYLLTGIVLVIIFDVFAPNVLGNRGEIIYVDDDNFLGPWDGTLEHPYQFIRDGVAAADPGFPLPGGLTLPLNRDAFTDLTFNFANTPFFVNFNGTLDNSGSGNAQFNTLGPLPNGFVGRTVQFAFILYGPFDFVSSPVAIKIVQ